MKHPPEQLALQHSMTLCQGHADALQDDVGAKLVPAVLKALGEDVAPMSALDRFARLQAATQAATQLMAVLTRFTGAMQ
ncbi:hypothetical protein JZU46_05560 [bacterium]|nr:hypothetical protein [bacterium]